MNKNEVLAKAIAIIASNFADYVLPLKMSTEELYKSKKFLETKAILSELEKLKDKDPIMEELFRKI